MASRWTRALVVGVLGVTALGACRSAPEANGQVAEPEIDATPSAPTVVDVPAPTHDSPLAPSPSSPSSATGHRPDRAGVFRGLGTWIDIYDERAWKHPAATVDDMAAQGVRTIYLQTSNYNRSRPFVHPEGVAGFLDAAERRGLHVVAWYLPGFRDVDLDLRRTLRAIAFETAAGNRFDSFALDIESSIVRRPSVRTARLLALSTRIRRAAGRAYPLGAIVASPRRMRQDPGYWPGFPWRGLAGTYDAFLPMTYFTYRVSGRDDAAWYTAKNVSIIRQETAGMKVPIHVIGGISFDATGAETRGFVDTIIERDVLGASYYTFPGITPEQWKALRAVE
ncbi:MAG TPA: hypothetical protein VIC58_08625 [Actinomycetota bacterium]|jgi:hypothetical protein